MLILITLLLSVSLAHCNTLPPADEQLTKFLENLNTDLGKLFHKQQMAELYLEVNGKKNQTATEEYEKIESAIFEYIRSLRPALAKFKRSPVLNEELKRQLNHIPELNFGVLSLEDAQKMSSAITNLEKYKDTLRDYCGIQQLEGGSEEAQKLKECWIKKSQELSFLVKEDWKTWLDMEKKTANFHGFNHPSDYWFKALDMKSEDVLKMLQKYLNELWPFFEQMQAYLRYKLQEKYGVENVPLNEPIPYHLYDSYVWNTWDTIDLPYPQNNKRNVTVGIMQRGLNNPKRAFLNVAEFFRSIGFAHLKQDFWEYNSQLSSDETCSFKVWNFFNIEPVQMTYCGEINEKRFFEMFEALFEVQFYKSVQNLPTILQVEPLPQFVEGLAKAFSLSAASLKYLEKLKIIEEGQSKEEDIINNLYEKAFRTMLPLPMFYIIERFRANVLDGKFDMNSNCEYWNLVEEFVGVEAPMRRTNEDFDIAEKLLVDATNELASGFMSILLKFQVFKHFCETTNQYSKFDPKRPLHMCDLSNQPSIGAKIIKGLSLGSSKSYHDVLEEIIGERQITTNGIIEYFKPLYEWLLEQNENENVAIGWVGKSMCSSKEKK